MRLAEAIDFDFKRCAYFGANVTRARRRAQQRVPHGEQHLRNAVLCCHGNGVEGAPECVAEVVRVRRVLV